MTEPKLDENALEAIAARLDLRTPNKEAVESIALELSQHVDVDVSDEAFVAVVDSATGMGKTYILAGALEYLAEVRGVTDFAIIAPGRTILNKTIDNFTPGHRKSIVDSMELAPFIVTADNFSNPSTRAAMADDSQVKVYIFTVQSLLRPRSKSDRKTHEFQEGLGGAFYEHLQSVDDLVIFADEHHCYFGKAFSEAIADLRPWALLGLTATPHRNTPDEMVIFRYPLAAAIAEQYVKTPVIVGRKDDRNDDKTKLLDGLTLLMAKADLAKAYSEESGQKMVNPVMLVVAQSIDEADEYERMICSDTFENGEWNDTVLTVHSNTADESLEALEMVESEESSVRIIIAVGMLKEGWDVKNVYVIVSMRASVSDILTEQTLGRGMRLPWGEYTGIEMLDTLEVLAHERYEQLLKKANVLNEAFVDHRTRAVLREKEGGEAGIVRVTSRVGAQVNGLDEVSDTTGGKPTASEEDASDVHVNAPKVTDFETRRKESRDSAPGLVKTYVPKTDMARIEVPRLLMKSVEARFSLADITDPEPFRRLGAQIAANPEDELRRVKVSARVLKGTDGLKRTELVTTPAEDRINSSAPLFPLATSREQLEDAVLSCDVVPARNIEREQAALQPLLDTFVSGLGADAECILSGYVARAAARLVRLVTDQAKRFATEPDFQNVVAINAVGGERHSRREVSKDRVAEFSKQKAYNSWKKSLYDVEWFDSSPERDFANVVDESSDVRCWVRLHKGEMPILWNNDGRRYNADFVVVENDDTHWVVEVKADKDMSTDDVTAKREAAKRWTNYVNTDATVSVTWRYLLLSETDISEAKGAWQAMKGFGS